MLKLKLKMKQKLKNKFPVSSLMLMLVLVLSSFTSITLQAQDRVTGKVTGKDGIPLPGVNVLQKGTSKGTVTDFDGRFTLLLGSGSKTLLFSYVGFKTQEVLVGADNIANAILEEDIESLDEIVVIGYKETERKDILGSVATVKQEAIEAATPVQAFDAVQGKLAGVNIVTNNGAGEGFDITIRGVSTFGGGSSPLFVVDGQQVENIDNLNPANIESIEVAKDGATASIYGVQAANGVVIVTTKSGKAGTLSVEVSTLTGVGSLVGDIPVANAPQRLELERIRRLSQNANNVALTAIERDSLSTIFKNANDLQASITRPAIRHQSNVTLRGGTEKVRYNWNTEFFNQDGIVNNSGYKRIGTQLKLDLTPNERFKAGTNINVTSEDRTGAQITSALSNIINRPANFPLFFGDGSFTPVLFGRPNPLAINEFSTQTNEQFRLRNLNYIEFALLPKKGARKFTLRSNLGFDYRNTRRDDFTPLILQNPNGNPVPRGRFRSDTRLRIQQENYINYNNRWGVHDFGVFAGMQFQRDTRENIDINGTEFANDIIQTINNAIVLNASNSFETSSSLLGLFGGVDYKIADKYLFAATIRRDASSRFSAKDPNNRSAIFPSASVGWRISKENFLKDSKFISDLKLRYSYGVAGNQSIGDFEILDRFQPGFQFAGQTGIGPALQGNNATFANRNLVWETTETNNFGMDLGILNNRFELSVDVYRKLTTDVLANISLPEETGFVSIRDNIGSIENRGIDINLNADIIKNKDFKWSTNFNLGYIENEVRTLTEEGVFNANGRFAYLVEVGESLGNIHGLRNLGVFQYDESNAFTPEGVQLTPNFDVDANGQLDPSQFVNYTLNGEVYTGTVNQLTDAGGNNTFLGGQTIYQDTNGDFRIDTDDTEVLGNGFASFVGGFSHDIRYKNFRFTTLFNYNLDFEIFREYDQFRNDFSAGQETPGADRIVNAWRQPGDITAFPRLDIRNIPVSTRRPPGTNGNQFADSFFVDDGSFIRWQYVRLFYDFPKNLVSRVKYLNKLSLNLGIQNLLTWTNFKGFNPELGRRGQSLTPGRDQLRSPNNREFTIGLTAKF